MRILLVKMSSLGDVIHTLPAVTDAKRLFPNLEIDWVVEEAFAEIPQWHPGVSRTIPVAIRRWRKSPLAARRSGEWEKFRKQLSSSTYDLVIDAQGLIKSAWIARKAGGPVVGYDSESIREPLASRFYTKTYSVSRQMHAVERTRQLMARALGYCTDDLALSYGFKVKATTAEAPYVVFLHGTTWATKHWPESKWLELAQICTDRGMQVKLVWGNEAEKQRAMRLAVIPGVEVMPRMALQQIAGLLQGASAVVSVDTGLGHLAAALDRPMVALYAPTNASLTGIYGLQQSSLTGSYHCAPCMKRRCRYDVLAAEAGKPFAPPCWQNITAEVVWSALSKFLHPK